MAIHFIAQTSDAINQNASFWSAFPGMLPWLILVLFVVLFFRPLRLILAGLAWRMKIGASVKVGSLELGSVPAVPGNEITPKESKYKVFVEDGNGIRGQERARYYESCRNVMLVHKVFKSFEEGQLFDIQIYLIPHFEGSLAGVARVEYFFGRMWGNKVFPSTNRFNGFAISTAAYGPFLCTARVVFASGDSFTQTRYIDFEMGATAPAILPKEIATLAP
jgi:hypothetical protein